MTFKLPDLPYAKDAFGERLSAETFDYHHGKHHNAYVVKANEIVSANPELAGKSLVELITLTLSGGPKGLFNQVGQIWNHSFYWLSLSPAPSEPTGRLLKLIDASFGSVDVMIDRLAAEAVGHFGSGWVSLNIDGDTLSIGSYHDADTPVAHGDVPLLILDVWEHAYYIDYRNARPAYAEAILRQAINWEFVASNLDGSGIGKADQPG